MMRRLPLSGCLVTVIIILCDLDQSIGESELYGQVSLLPCSANTEPSIGFRVNIQLSSESYDVCLNGFNRGAAAAVCRQLGYADADPVPGKDGEYVFYGEPDLYDCFEDNPTEVISHVNCPVVSDYSLYGELHVMRCSVGDPVPWDTCQQTTTLRCKSQVLPNNGYSYNGRVNFDSMDQYHGLVKINLHGAAKLVCLDNLFFEENTDKDYEAIGSSVCRQMGFTNGKGKSSPNQDADHTYQFSSLNCNSETGSYQCFSHCISQAEVTSPDECQYVLSVSCSYDPSVAELMTSGSSSVCSLQERCSSLPVSTNTSTTSPYYISTIVLGAVLGAENIPICLICTIACLRRHCCRPPPDHNRPNANEHQVLLRNNVYRRED